MKSSFKKAVNLAKSLFGCLYLKTIIMDLPQDGAHRPYCTPTDRVTVLSWRAKRFPRAYLKVFSADFCFITF